MAFSSIFCFLTISTVCKKRTEIRYAGGIQKIKDGSFSNPEKVKPPSSSFMNMGMILIKLQKNEGSGLAEVGQTFNNTILFNSGTPLHSIASVRNALLGIISKDLAHQLILDRSWSFIDIDDIRYMTKNRLCKSPQEPPCQWRRCHQGQICCFSVPLCLFGHEQDHLH